MIMSTYKTQIDANDVQVFLEQNYQKVNNIRKIVEGESSQAYSFICSEGKRILRVNTNGNQGFLKDLLAHQRFNSTDIPIPAILAVGEMAKDVYFAVSVQSEGEMVSKLNKQQNKIILPELVRMLDHIHSLTPIADGYGEWDAEGKGKYNSWQDVLLAWLEENWAETKAAPFYDESLHDELRRHIRGLLEYCPEVRTLVHGDFGLENLMSDGNHITGVIDWEMSMYGDFLYDIAWLDRWGTRHGYGYAGIFKEYYKSQNRMPENYDQRIQCYKLCIALDSLGFYAYSRQPNKYQNIKGALLEEKRKA